MRLRRGAALGGGHVSLGLGRLERCVEGFSHDDSRVRAWDEAGVQGDAVRLLKGEAQHRLVRGQVVPLATRLVRSHELCQRRPACCILIKQVLLLKVWLTLFQN